MNSLLSLDKQIHALLTREALRQEDSINLIASENYAPLAVLQATASSATNKYAEGYPGKRYYAGCEVIDEIESLAIERCKTLFNTDYHCNVQPHAGSSANMAAYMALIKPGDTIMGMSLIDGGHLTHGHPVNFSGLLYKIVSYTLDRTTETLDYDKIALLAEQHRPRIIVAGASAYSRFIDFERFSQIATEIGAFFVADIAHIAGLIATGLHPSPLPHADIVTSTTHKTLRGPRGGLIMAQKDFALAVDRAIMPGTQGGPFMHSIAAKATAFQLAHQPVFASYQKQIIINARAMAETAQSLDYRIVSGKTDNHLFVIDMTNKGLSGLETEEVLASVGITVSRSCIPFDPLKPWITSGIRIGTPAITSRGMHPETCIEIMYLINEVLLHRNNQKKLSTIAHRIKSIANDYPLYSETDTLAFSPFKVNKECLI